MMISQTLGENISQPEVTNVSSHGVWLLCGNKKFFMSYEDFPWFKNVPVGEIFNVEEVSPGHLYWPRHNSDIENVPFHIGDKRITKAFIKGLDKKGIFYVKTDEDSLLIARTDEEETFSLLEGVARQFIRPYRNASFSPGGLEVAKEALDEKELKYEIVEVFGTETIIWGEEDNESIQSTLSELPIGRAEQLW